MKRKTYWGVAILIILLIGVSVFMLTRQTETEPAEVYKSPAPEEKKEVDDNIQEVIDKAKKNQPLAEKEHQVVSNENSQAKTVHTSSNPMFADGVPEHLQCPDQWIGMYSREIKADPGERARINGPRIDEILSKYNPQRPLTEVWPLFIEAEKYYYANADPERATPGQGAGRFDWQYQNLLDFPEVFVLSNIDTERYVTMRQVAIGRWGPDVNLHILQDGREFRAKTGYNYTEISEKMDVNEKGDVFGTGTSVGFGHSDRNAESVKIYLAETSDEELKRQGGWNYNIDPYATGIYTLPEDATERVLEMNRNTYGGLKK